jgi:hypothetical protein
MAPCRRTTRTHRPLAVLATALVSLALLAGCHAQDAIVVAPASPVPAAPAPTSPAVARGAFWSGVYLGDEASTPERVSAAMADFTRLGGRAPALVKTFHALDADLAPAGWAGRVLHAIAATGATNFVALDLDWQGRAAGPLLDAILRGDADLRLDRAARALAAIGATVLVEPAWEMNGDWSYRWQGVANGGDASAPAKYASAWRHVVDRFRAAGATNVRWVFNPNVGNAVAGRAAGPSHWNWYGHYYPGDAYVDFVGAHGYEAPVAFRTPHHRFDDLFYGADGDSVLADMERRFANKPIILGELAAEETPGRDKGEWVRRAYERMLADPRVVGAVWFNMRKEADWRIDSSAGSLEAYRAAMRNPAVAERFATPMVASRE